GAGADFDVHISVRWGTCNARDTNRLCVFGHDGLPLVCGWPKRGQPIPSWSNASKGASPVWGTIALDRCDIFSALRNATSATRDSARRPIGGEARRRKLLRSDRRRVGG